MHLFRSRHNFALGALAGLMLVATPLAAAAAPPAQQRLRLPEDLGKIVTDPAKLKKPEGLTVACYTFPNYHLPPCRAGCMDRGGRNMCSRAARGHGFRAINSRARRCLGELDESKPETWERYNELAQ